MDTWFAYSPVKNNPEDAAKVKYFCIAFFFRLQILQIILVCSYFFTVLLNGLVNQTKRVHEEALKLSFYLTHMGSN